MCPFLLLCGNKHGSVMERATHMSFSQSSLLLFLDLISTTYFENKWWRYEVANIVSIEKHLQQYDDILPFGGSKILTVLLHQRPHVERGSAEVLRSPRYMYKSLTFSGAISKLKSFCTHAGDCWIPLRFSAISSRSLHSSQHCLLLVPFDRS